VLTQPLRTSGSGPNDSFELDTVLLPGHRLVPAESGSGAASKPDGDGDLTEQQTVLLVPQADGTLVKPAPAPRYGEDLAGSVIGQYHVKELIGRGSFGEVYRAVDPRLGRDVAIKVAERSIAEDARARERFWNEARIQARLEHSNIVPIYDLLEESGLLVMVMRLVHGEDLDKRLKQMVRPFTPAETLRLMRHIASALGTAHDKGVIHQDLKPGNIRLTPAGEAVVLDFGVARITGQAAADQPGAAGTPGYMSPEQIRGESIDARSDIYALAMTLYKTLTGHHPFEEAGNLGELLAWQVEREPAPPTRYNPHIPTTLSETILQGLAKNPRERFRACADFTRAVSSALGIEEEVALGGRDGRWDPRASVRLPCQVQLPGEEPFDSQIIDLSTTGAAVRLPRPLPAGCRAGLVIRIPLKGSAHRVHCTMRVRRTRPAHNGEGFRAGVAFEGLGEFDRAVLGDLVRALLVVSESG
jgi:serine/threonine-protein kinase